jgi:hypothetical protein
MLTCALNADIRGVVRRNRLRLLARLDPVPFSNRVFFRRFPFGERIAP